MLSAQVVEGSVSHSVTRLGVSEVTVRLHLQIGMDPTKDLKSQAEQLEQAQQNPHYAITDLAGRFRIEGVKEGKYRVEVFREGFQALPLSAPVEVKEGDPVELELKMAPLGRVTGRVLNGKGDPVSGAKLQMAGQAGGTQGRIADENGEFDMVNVYGGSYTLLAYAPDELAPPEPVDGQQMAWAPTYYPGIMYADSAARVLVAPGAEVAGIEIKLLAAPARQVSGVVLGADGKPAADAAVQLTSGSGRPTGQLRTATDEEGKFEISTVDGTYRVISDLAGEANTLHGESEVLVAGKDVRDVKLQLVASFHIHGTVSYDPPLPPESKSHAPILLTNANPRGMMFTQSFAVEGDSFNIPDLYPGTYTLLASEPDPPYYLASVRVGGQDGMAGPVNLSAADDHAEVVFRADGGTVSGTVENCRTGGRVTLIPVEQNLWKPSPRVGLCDAVGHFTIAGVRPGDYYAVAVALSNSGVPPLELVVPNLRPASTEELLKQGSKVTVKPGEATHVDLKTAKLAVPQQ